jgi:hypothetical protein
MAAFRWRLPRTVLDVDVALTPGGCKGDAFTVIVKPQVTPRAIADDKVGDAGWVELDPHQLESFWNDDSFTFKTFPSTGGLLQSVGSTTSSQAGTIVGNTITGVVKIAAAAFGVPSVQAAVPLALVRYQSPCGMQPEVAATLARIKADKKLALGASIETAQKYANLVQALQDSITIHVKATIDPGTTQPTRTNAGLVFVEAPTRQELVSKWLVRVKERQVQSLIAQSTTEVHLDTAKAQPACASSDTSCTTTNVAIAPGTLYREARYVPVRIVTFATPADPDARDVPQDVAFGQFGIARTLPMNAAAFKNLTWEVDLTTFGEVSGANFGSKSTGAAISGAFASAAGGANAIASEQRASVTAMPADTTLLQNKAAALKAQVDVSTYQNQLNALKLQSGQQDNP